MQIGQQLCQIQGHESNQLSYICTFINCLHDTRWLCQECKRCQIHDHRDMIQRFSYLKTEMDFMNDFKIKNQSSIESRLNSEEGIQIKSQYIQKIKNDLTNDAIFKLVQHNDFNYKFSNQILINIIIDLIECYNREIRVIQNLRNPFQQLIHYGLRSLNLNQINILLNNQDIFLQGENKFYKRIIKQFKKNYHELSQKTFRYRDYLMKLFEDIFKRLIKLKDYMQYHECHSIYNQGIRYSFVYLLQNEKYLATLNSKKKLYITDMNSKRFKKQILFNVSPILMSFDNQWRHMIIFDTKYNLSQYNLSRNVRNIKQIRKYKFGKELTNQLLINDHKFMIVMNNIVEIRDLTRNRCVNKIILKNYHSYEAKIELVFYGKVKRIIVITRQVNHYSNISICSDYQCQPFICQNVKTEFAISIRKITLTSDDLQLLTHDLRALKLWQIDYQNRRLILINMICITGDDSYWFSYNSSQFKIIKFQDGYLQILDNNFNISQEISLHRVYKCDKIQFSEQFILIINGSSDWNQTDRINILRKSRIDYDKLQLQ